MSKVSVLVICGVVMEVLFNIVYFLFGYVDNILLFGVIRLIF